MHRIDRIYMQYPFFGSRQMCATLVLEGYTVNRKRIKRLMRLMGLKAIYCEPSMSIPNAAHQKYPYLLRDVLIERVNQVWSIDITYIPMRNGFLYLVAVIDWFSRYVLSWGLSNSLCHDFCIDALVRSLKLGTPEIFNSDQGAQFTALEFLKELLDRNIKVSMDGRGRALDNVYIERLWRSVKYEEIYLNDYALGSDVFQALKRYFKFYNTQRPHSALANATPHKVFHLR